MLKEKGFTLVEIAIVLVIIGLLIGGILKGQQMIRNAKAKRLYKMADELRVAWNTFYDKYNQIPGDENINGIPEGESGNGDGDGIIDSGEQGAVFEDLSKAGLISGDYDGSNFPKHPFGGEVRIVWANVNGSGYKHWIRFMNVPWDIAQQIDMKYDDGKYDSGSIQANEEYQKSNDPINYFYIEL